MKAKYLAVMLALYAFSLGAFAAVPADVTSAIATAKTDSETIAGSVLGIVVAIFALKIVRKAL